MKKKHISNQRNLIIQLTWFVQANLNRNVSVVVELIICRNSKNFSGNSHKLQKLPKILQNWRIFDEFNFN